MKREALKWARLRPNFPLHVSRFTLFLVLAACGGGGNSGSPPPGRAVAVDTLAYVVTGCSEDTQQTTARQALKIRQRNGEAITVTEFPMLGPVPPLGLCRGYGQLRDGQGSVIVLPFQRLGVSPDGSTVVFEVTDDFSLIHELFPPESLLPPERKGFFAVNADGSNLRKLGPASREASFRGNADASVADFRSTVGFAPDGRQIVFTDLGPAPDGQEAVQVFALDLATGARRQISQEPRLTPYPPIGITVSFPSFLDADRVVFLEQSVEEGNVYVITKADGTGVISRTPAQKATGSALIARFSITPQASVAFPLDVPGTPVNPCPGCTIGEIFVDAGDNRLQLTHFGRYDTGASGVLLSPDRTQVLFTASADPFGANPHENCQFFSIDTLGADLRQVTALSNGEHNGVCSFNGMGCLVFVVGQDLASDSVVFASTCNPITGASNGYDIFAMRFDGTEVHELTTTHGMTTDPDGTVHVELPGPYAYPQVFR